MMGTVNTLFACCKWIQCSSSHLTIDAIGFHVGVGGSQVEADRPASLQTMILPASNVSPVAPVIFSFHTFPS